MLISVVALWWAAVPGHVGAPTSLWAAGVVLTVLIGVAWISLSWTTAMPEGASRPMLRNWRYWLAVVFEVLVIALGCQVLTRTGHGVYTLALILVVFGLHFLPLSWALLGRVNSVFGALAAALVLCGVVYGTVRLAGSPTWGLGLFGGTLPGLFLVSSGIVPLLRVRSAHRSRI